MPLDSQHSAEQGLQPGCLSQGNSPPSSRSNSYSVDSVRMVGSRLLPPPLSKSLEVSPPPSRRDACEMLRSRLLPPPLCIHLLRRLDGVHMLPEYGMGCICDGRLLLPPLRPTRKPCHPRTEFPRPIAPPISSLAFRQQFTSLRASFSPTSPPLSFHNDSPRCEHHVIIRACSGATVVLYMIFPSPLHDSCKPSSLSRLSILAAIHTQCHTPNTPTTCEGGQGTL